MAYKIALWKADSQKRGVNPSNNQDAVDISLSPETDSEDGRGEDSDTAEDGMQVTRNDPLKQRQVSPSSSPLEGRYLTGFMRSPDKTQPDAQACKASSG